MNPSEQELDLATITSSIEKKRSSSSEIHPSQVIRQLSSLVNLSDDSSNFIEKQQLINEHSLMLHQHHQLTNSELESKIHFLSRLIAIGAFYIKKVQETVISLKRDQSVLTQRINEHDNQVGLLNENIHLLKTELANDLTRIEKLEASSTTGNAMRYTLYIIISYLILRRKFKSIASVATIYSIIGQREQMKDVLKSLLYKLF